MIRHDIIRANASYLVIIAALVMSLAGVIHLVIAPGHWDHAPPQSVLFVVLGSAQVLWGIAFWRQPLKGLLRVGIVLAGGSTVLWALTRVLPAPFHDGPEPVDLISTISKLTEVIVVATLVVLVLSQTPSNTARGVIWRQLAWLSLVALLIGAGLVGIGWATEAWVPGFEHTRPYTRSLMPPSLCEEERIREEHQTNEHE